MAARNSYGSTPGGDEARYYGASPSPTPSPRGGYGGYYASTPQRPATRAGHSRHMSSGGAYEFIARPPTASPRYTSDGRYATSDKRFSAATVTPNGGYSYLDREAGYESPRYQPQPVPAEPRRSSHTRRSSTSVPQRCQTARPGSSHRKAAPVPAAPRMATEADAKKHHIPAGYSLKNWDPTEEPIMLLGSVFDANSLGKWIYDWTVFCRGTDAPIAHMAGDLWLLLIELGGKIKHAENTMPKIRTAENKELVEDFIDSGERVMDKLRELLKSAEAPMLKSSASKKEKKTQLGKNAGVEFVETLFGRERELRRTELFMQGVRTWNHRFTVNCEAVLANPGL